MGELKKEAAECFKSHGAVTLEFHRDNAPSNFVTYQDIEDAFYDIEFWWEIREISIHY